MMMLRSPIPDTFWSGLFTTVVATTAACTLGSMLREKAYKGYEPIAEPLAHLQSKQLDFDTVIAALHDLALAVDADAMQKRGSVKLYLRRHAVARLLVKLLKFRTDAADESSAVCKGVFILVDKVFAVDSEGRDAWHAAGGHKNLLALVSVAHREGQTKLLEEAALALKQVTDVDQDDMVLSTDVPEGSAGAMALCKFGSTVSMLRILDKHARVGFLVNITSVLASLSTLEPGGRALSKGIDGRSGASYFLELLDPRGNQLLNENCIRALKWIVKHDKSSHKEIAEQANVAKLVDLLDGMQTTPTLLALLTLCATMSFQAAKKEFLTEFMALNGPTALIRLWCKADDKDVRMFAEELTHMLRTMPLCVDEITRLFDIHRPMLQERRARDEEAARKAQMQRRQQQQQQEMMMMQMMGGGGGMPPGMEDE